MTGGTTPVEALLKRDRHIVICSLIIIAALAWWWVLTGAGTGMSTIAMSTWEFPPPLHPALIQEWTATYSIVMFLMWWVMMIAMMTPSAAPVILLYAHAHRHARKYGTINAASTPIFSFAAGYLLSWAGFSLVATALQLALERAGLMHAMMMWSIEPLLTATVLVTAGLYQLTPLKAACLDHCRSPAQFIAANFKPHPMGALQMGLKHGAFCLGCCWLLMALLFAGGIMNLVWIAGLTILVLAEKNLPRGALIARASGIAMICAGLWILPRASVG
jgi:predicted metal-binding membrane protein